MKILILGITSSVGFRFYKLNKTFDVYGICRKWPNNDTKNIFECKTIDFEYIKNIINDIRPDVIINCLSVANVDKCEENSTLCDYLNYELVSKLVYLTNKINIRVVFFSSAIIYDGYGFPYAETAIAKPINRYGQCKLKADILIERNSKNYLLFRPTAIFGVTYPFQRNNPATFIVNKLVKNKQVTLADDVISNLLFLDDLIAVISELVCTDVIGTFNVGGDEIISRYALGKVIQRYIGIQNTKIERCLSSDFKSKAQRPLNTTLVNLKIKKFSRLKFTNFEHAINRIITEQAIIDVTIPKGNSSDKK